MSLSIKNKDVLGLMQSFQQSVSQDTIKSKVKPPDVWHQDQYQEIVKVVNSSQYLDDILNQKVPYQKYSFNQTFGETTSGSAFVSGLKPVIDFDRYYTSAYVPRGFVSWHHDGEFAGWFVMFTYSPYQNGYFRWRDPATGSIHTRHDHEIWMSSSGYISADAPDHFWHCCEARDARYTIIVVFDRDIEYQQAIKTLTTA